jgi:hypothetical protein
MVGGEWLGRGKTGKVVVAFALRADEADEDAFRQENGTNLFSLKQWGRMSIHFSSLIDNPFPQAEPTSIAPDSPESPCSRSARPSLSCALNGGVNSDDIAACRAERSPAPLQPPHRHFAAATATGT